MIPIPSALDTGNYRLRAQRVVGDGHWAMLTGEPARPDAHPLDSAPSVDALLSDVPDGAWQGTAGTLQRLIAPVGGEHCPRCSDTLSAPCPCCGGTGQIQCGAAGCIATHVCSTCDGDGADTCDCAIAANLRIARIRGEAWGGLVLARLRALLCALPPETPVAAWTVHVGPTRHRGKTVPLHALLVDVSGELRWMAASTVAADEDEITEVIL